ncbi:unnamed protein product [Trichobilharzia regenti]|nr:unnamed protein product [Trichobilharzia regenti]
MRELESDAITLLEQSVTEIEKSALSSGETHTHENGFSFPGVEVIQDFISESEEAMLISVIDEQPWFLSQSGRRKQVSMIHVICGDSLV